VRSASVRGKPDNIAALAMTAAAVSMPIRPDAAISPARHAAQNVSEFLSPSAAHAILRTKPASA
jgi:hypothetical protein